MKNIIEKFKISLKKSLLVELEEIKMLQAKQLLLLREQKNITDIHTAEFKVFSQWGEDGIIQWIISKLPCIPPVFIEFGVENYQESNTRFLLLNNNWKGLIIDGDARNIDEIRASSWYWRRKLKAINSFVTRENINSLFVENEFTGEIGILSIDVDGNDYWIWEAIEAVNPWVVICEYNSAWGSEKSLTIPYHPQFMRTEAHYSNLYYGASINALTNLAKQKGYSLIGSNSAGNNVFFIRNDHAKFFEVPKASDAFVASSFRESREKNGSLSYLEGDDRLKILKDLQLLDLDSGDLLSVAELFNLN